MTISKGFHRGVRSSLLSVKGRRVIFTFIINCVPVLVFWHGVYIEISVFPGPKNICAQRTSFVPGQFAVTVRLCLKPCSLLKLDHGSNASEINICDMKGTCTTWLLIWRNWRLRSRWTSLPLHLIPPPPLLYKLLQNVDMLYCSVTLALCSVMLPLWVAVKCGCVHRPAVFLCQSDGLAFSSEKMHSFANMHLSHLS